MFHPATCCMSKKLIWLPIRQRWSSFPSPLIEMIWENHQCDKSLKIYPNANSFIPDPCSPGPSKVGQTITNDSFFFFFYLRLRFKVEVLIRKDAYNIVVFPWVHRTDFDIYAVIVRYQTLWLQTPGIKRDWVIVSEALQYRSVPWYKTRKRLIL